MNLDMNMWEGLSTYLFIEKKLTAHAKGATAKSRFKALVGFFSTIPFNKNNFNLFVLEKQKEGKGNAYINNLITMAKHVDRYLKLHELTDYTYFKKEKKIVEILSPDEIKAIAEVHVPYARQTRERNHRYKTLIYFLALTGCRISECLNLKWIDLNDQMCIFRDTKNGSERICPIPPFLYDLISQLPKTSELVFPSDKNGRTDISYINEDLKRRASLARVNNRVYNHIFRHSYITEMLKSGVDVTMVASLVGHNDLASTQHYTHYLINDLMISSMSHPLLKQGMTTEMISKRLKDYVTKLVDKDRFSISITETNFGIDISIRKD